MRCNRTLSALAAVSIFWDAPPAIAEFALDADLRSLINQTGVPIVADLSVGEAAIIAGGICNHEEVAHFDSYTRVQPQRSERWNTVLAKRLPGNAISITVERSNLSGVSVKETVLDLLVNGTAEPCEAIEFDPSRYLIIADILGYRASSQMMTEGAP